MKVIFLQDVPRVAYAGDIKEVADGYARNYLIPKQLAAVAKPGAINMVAAQQAKMATEFSGLAGKIDGQEINLKARVGANDRLFGAITAADIATELNRVAEVDIDKRKIALDKPIHQLGDYEIAVRLAKDLVPKIKVTVSKEETEKTTEEVAEKATEEVAEKAPEEVAEKTPEEVAEKAPEEIAEKAPEEVAEKTPEEVAEKATEEVAEKAPEEVAEKAPEEVAEKAPEEVAEKAPEEVAEEMTEEETVKETE